MNKETAYLVVGWSPFAVNLFILMDNNPPEDYTRAFARFYVSHLLLASWNFTIEKYIRNYDWVDVWDWMRGRLTAKRLAEIDLDSMWYPAFNLVVTPIVLISQGGPPRVVWINSICVTVALALIIRERWPKYRHVPRKKKDKPSVLVRKNVD